MHWKRFLVTLCHVVAVQEFFAWKSIENFYYHKSAKVLLIYGFHPSSRNKKRVWFFCSPLNFECIFEYQMAVLLQRRKISCNFFCVTFPELITDKQANSIREMHSIKPLHQSYIPSSPLLAHHTHTRSHLKSICNSIFHTANGIQYNISMLTDNDVSTFLSAYLLCRAHIL